MHKWIIVVLFMLASLAGSERDVKICLVMVVQDQDTVIRDCLKSVEDFIDAVCIIDTGSTDWTYYVAEEFLGQSGLPGIVFKHHKNKNLALEAAIEIALEVLHGADFLPQDTYFLLLNADMTVKCSPRFQKNTLDKDSYLVLQQSSTLSCSFYEQRLFLASLPWKHTGKI